MTVDEKIKVAVVIGSTGYVYSPVDPFRPGAGRRLYSEREFSSRGQALEWHRDFMETQRS